MAKKEATAVVKLQLIGGKAVMNQAVGSSLGPTGIQQMDFLKQFNEKTQHQLGMVTPVIVTVYKDRSFDFVVKTPPAAVLLKKAANITKGAGNSLMEKAGSVTKAQVKEIAELKMKDLNAASIEAAMKVIAGTARSMGITVVD